MMQNGRAHAQAHGGGEPVSAELALGPSFAPGERVGPWVLRRRLQGGGSAVVFHAYHHANGVDAALKIGRRDFPSPEVLARSLAYEAELLRRVQHPHVVSLYEHGALEDGTPYLAMELARGHDLAERLEQHGTLAVPMVVEIGRQILAALEALAAAGVVHRDLKPENVMLEETAGGFRVKLVDLGIAVSTLAPWTDRLEGTSGAFAGTPEYVSPEQAQGLPVDARADLYSLGAVLYECLTGSPPCTGSTPYETLVRVITADPLPVRVTRPDCPASLEHVVMQALAKEPDARFQSAASMARALRRCARIGAMPEGLAAWEGAPLVPSNATRPFELSRLRSSAPPSSAFEDRTLVDVLPLEGERAPRGDPTLAGFDDATVGGPPRLEPTVALRLPEPPPRDRPVAFVEAEDTARWLWPLAVVVLVIALLGAILGSGELRLHGFGSAPPAPVLLP